MKKIILAIFILLAFEVFSLNTIIFGGLSTNREVNMKVYSGGVLALESDVEAIDSYDFGIESFISPSEYLNFGLGLRYEPELKEEDSDGIANIIPIYLITKFLLPISSTYLTIQANAGYSLVIPLDSAEDQGFTNIVGGLYYGIGVGYELGALVLGANYSVSTLTADFLGIADFEASAPKLNFTLGYKFGQ